MSHIPESPLCPATQNMGKDQNKLGSYSLLVGQFLRLHVFHFLESMYQRKTVKPEHFLGAKEADEHDNDAGQLKYEKDIQVTNERQVGAA